MTMLFAAIEVLGVRWIGDRSIAAEAGSAVGSLMVALVAVYAARLAARTANERQKKQLEHDTQRQEEALTNDAHRLQEQLDHDRESRQREHARDALDASIELVGEVNGAFGDLLGGVEWCEEQREEYQELLEDEDGGERREAAVEYLDQTGKEFNEVYLRVASKLLEMYPAGMRLKVRLGTQQEICLRYEELLDALQAAVDSLREVSERNRSEAEKAATANAYGEVRSKFAGFMIACERWLQ